MVISGTVEAGRPGIAFMGLMVAVMTAIYLFRLFHAVFAGERKTEGHEGTKLMVAIVFFLALLSLIAGVFVGIFGSFAELSASQLLRGIK